MLSKNRIIVAVVLVEIVSASCFLYVKYTNIQLQQNIISIEKSREEEQQAQRQKMLGKGDTVIGDGENILNDSFGKK